MKRRIAYFIGILAVLVGLSVQVEAKKKKQDGNAKPVFAETVYDFGVIEEKKGPVSHEFAFSNDGDGNLLILNATAECGCTRPDYPKEPIAPGKKKAIKVTYNPSGRPGPFEKTVTLTTNGSPRKMRLKIRGTVK